MLNPIEKLMIKLLEGTGSLVNRSAKADGNVFGKGSLLLGRAGSLYRPNRIENIYLLPEARLRHVYILGATGSGKTKLLEYLIRQDILETRGFCLIDPHGDLYRNILNFLAYLFSVGESKYLLPYFSQKLILIEPLNEKWTVVFNPLEVKDTDPYTQTSEFMGIFKKLWADAYWGPRMEELLRNTLITLSMNGLTLLEAKLLLTDSPFREELVASLPPGEVKDYWVYRYAVLSDKMKAIYREPILNRLSAFISNPAVRLIIGQAQSTIDFRRIMDQGQWLLVNLSKGKLKGNACLLGALIIAKLQLAALSRVEVPEEKRVPFSLIVDEFQNFMGEDFETILSEARKYGLGLIMAHQNLDQVGRQMRAAILGNAATQVFFRLSNHDASVLSSELSHREKAMVQRKLIDFKAREAYLKRKGERPRLLKTVFVPEARAANDALELIKSLSFTCHGRLKQELEAELLKRTQITAPETGVQRKPNLKADAYKGRFAPHGEFEEAHEC